MSGESPSSSESTPAVAGSGTGTLSLSMAGGCRMRLWLKAHGYQPEPTPATTQRTFDYGDVIEWLLFASLRIPSSHDESGFKEVGNWWAKLPVLKEAKTGEFIYPEICEVKDRQMEVSVGGFKGHIDGWSDIQIMTGDLAEEGHASPTLIDCKSANGHSYARACGEDLGVNVFSREYVITQNMYMKGLRDKGMIVRRGILVYNNKEVGQMMFRLLPFDQAMVDEGLERLNTGMQKQEPMPDWAWISGETIPMRCGYCEQKLNCAAVRGQAITGPHFDKRGKPTWRVG